jgi:cytochrome c oxidase assembly factor CtaG/polyferredoxin
MSPTAQAILSSWTFESRIVVVLVLPLILYLLGWRILHGTSPERFPAWRAVAFTGGLVALWLAMASPLDAFSGLLLSAHMVQHLLLMSVAPPLILLGAPLLPLLRGLPRKFARDGVGPFLVWPALRRVGNAVTHPVSCWIVMAIMLCAWHVPAAFDLALRSPSWHKVEHACFLGAALLFWWPVVRSFPCRPRWPLWSVPLYLLAADLLNTTLSAILTFSDHVLYQPYLVAPRLFGTTALTDQNCAGVIMWVPGSLVFLIPAALIAMQYLTPSQLLVRPQRVNTFNHGWTRMNTDEIRISHSKIVSRLMGLWTAFRKIRRRLNPCPSVPIGGQFSGTGSGRFDLLSVPLVGRFLHSQAGRRILQTTLFLVAVAVILDGLFGPQVSSANLAGVLPWTYWRILVVIALLAAGNLFCLACPFTLFRQLGQRLGYRQRPWPRALRSKWLGIGLLVLFFWGYEVFSLWDKPIWTAWLIINYFLVAFAIDALFSGASFCKYVCPIGQFQFVASLVSPLEVKVREPAVCAGCKTHDCLRGNHRQRGCEMDLYLPRKAGNFDCTFCLDCVRACPHDNIAVMTVAPGAAVFRDAQPSAMRRRLLKPDITALALVFVFAAFANAALMVSPITRWRDHITMRLNLTSDLPVTTALLVFSLIIAPMILVCGSVLAGRAVAGLAVPKGELIRRFSLALVPLALAMWAAHFLFHFVMGWNSAWPALQRALGELGLALANQQAFRTSNLLSPENVRILQTVLLDAGLLVTLYLGWRVARIYAPKLRLAVRVMAPWGSLAVALYLFGLWTCLQPMQMRGLATASCKSAKVRATLSQHAAHGGHRQYWYSGPARWDSVPLSALSLDDNPGPSSEPARPTPRRRARHAVACGWEGPEDRHVYSNQAAKATQGPLGPACLDKKTTKRKFGRCPAQRVVSRTMPVLMDLGRDSAQASYKRGGPPDLGMALQCCARGVTTRAENDVIQSQGRYGVTRPLGRGGRLPAQTSANAFCLLPSSGRV